MRSAESISRSGVANFSVKGMTLQDMFNSANSHRQYANEHEYSNKTLLTKQAVGQIQTTSGKFARP